MAHFGTDGIRAKAEQFNKEYLCKIARAAISAMSPKRVIIGRDTRYSGPFIESVLCDEFAKKGVEVIKAGIVPSPALAYLAKKRETDFGVVISASHNPPEYNGIKFFSRLAEKIGDAEEKRIDYFIDNPVYIPDAPTPAEIMSYPNAENDYTNFLIDSVRPDLSGMKVCLDCANGAASIVAPELFRQLGAAVTVLNGHTDGYDINAGCGAASPQFLLNAMSGGSSDIGFCYDGDGDRVMAVQNGKLFNGDHILYMHAKDMKSKGALRRDTLVATVMSNMGTEIACRNQGITLLRTAVGDKYVYREMTSGGYNIGGEESGHLIFSDYMPTGDGLMASILTAALSNRVPLAELDDIAEYPKTIRSYYCGKAAMQRFYEDEEIQGYLGALSFEGRHVVRPSGTEPKIRILVEARDEALAAQKAAEIEELLTRRLK